MIGPLEIVLIAFGAGLALALAWSIYRTAARREQIDEWARRHRVVLTERSRPMVAAYLTRSRKYRLTGALIGLLIPFGTKIPGLEIASGYLIGSLLAEFTHRPKVTDGARVASLTPRSLNDYVPSYAAKLLRATTAAGAVLLALFVWGPRRSAPGLVIHETSAYLGAASVILLPILVEFLMRRIVARPQQAGSEDVVAAADAVRVSSLHAVTAAGLCVTMLLLATFATAVGFISSVGILRWALLTTGAAVFLLAVALWFKLGPTATWKVRRNPDPAGAQA